jgi:hypothetical protein
VSVSGADPSTGVTVSPPGSVPVPLARAEAGGTSSARMPAAIAATSGMRLPPPVAALPVPLPIKRPFLIALDTCWRATSKLCRTARPGSGAWRGFPQIAGIRALLCKCVYANRRVTRVEDDRRGVNCGSPYPGKARGAETVRGSRRGRSAVRAPGRRPGRSNPWRAPRHRGRPMRAPDRLPHAGRTQCRPAVQRPPAPSGHLAR